MCCSCWVLFLTTNCHFSPCGFRQHEGVTSALLVGSQVIRHAPADAQAELWGPFVAAAWPWTMWHHHAIRSPPSTRHDHAAGSAHSNNSLCHRCVHVSSMRVWVHCCNLARPATIDFLSELLKLHSVWCTWLAHMICYCPQHAKKVHISVRCWLLDAG